MEDTCKCKCSEPKRNAMTLEARVGTVQDCGLLKQRFIAPRYCYSHCSESRIQGSHTESHSGSQWTPSSKTQENRYVIRSRAIPYRGAEPYSNITDLESRSVLVYNKIVRTDSETTSGAGWIV
ncbi:hypothetical protein TNCV_1227231 [Trichonephila clavipes]|nr:hypothetical protein TNCV_1227231 [Trichonephila clavipes]